MRSGIVLIAAAAEEAETPAANPRDFDDRLAMAGQFGFFVFVRPGPHIAAGWDPGGFPQWRLTQASRTPRGFTPLSWHPIRNLPELNEPVARVQTRVSNHPAIRIVALNFIRVAFSAGNVPSRTRPGHNPGKQAAPSRLDG